MTSPNDEDRKNYSYDVLTSKFHSCPEKFLSLGDKVRAKFRIWDTPNDLGNWGWVSAEKGELGLVVHVEKGCWPTVRFENGRSTCVMNFEVENVTDET